jgi:DUF1680 family protein
VRARVSRGGHVKMSVSWSHTPCEFDELITIIASYTNYIFIETGMAA